MSIMEGGYLPWKNKKTEDEVDMLDIYGKPLPTPPVGSEWVKQDDKTWELKQRVVINPANESPCTTDTYGLVEHTVMPSDTLQGICLRYRVSATEVRRVNYFSGNSIQFKKTLYIPVSTEHSPGPVAQPHDSKEVLVQKFRNATGESIPESRIYLEEHHWDLKLAVVAWENDSKWEGTQSPSSAAVAEAVPVKSGDMTSPCNVVQAEPTTVLAFAAGTGTSTTVETLGTNSNGSESQINAVTTEVAPLSVIEMSVL